MTSSTATTADPGTRRGQQPRRRLRQRRWAWAAMGVALVMVLVIGWRAPPTEGRSDDRLFAIAAQMKCLQCVGESVANSQAPIAEQMRAEIRAQMDQGRTDDEILAYFADRYQSRVLLNPPSEGVAGLVWVIPVVAIAVAVAALALAFSRWRSVAATTEALGPEAQRRVSDALAERARRRDGKNVEAERQADGRD